jgi:hypothetical protein
MCLARSGPADRGGGGPVQPDDDVLHSRETRTTPALIMPSARAALMDRSITRP